MSSDKCVVCRCQQIGVKLGGRKVLHNIIMDFYSGTLVCIIGPNGAGKTSLLRALNDELPTEDGQILCNGQNLQNWSASDRAKWQAVLPQSSSLAFPYTVEEVVSLARIPHATGNEKDNAIVANAIEAMDLTDKREQLYTHLSGGEKQRVQLARVFAQVWDRLLDFPEDENATSTPNPMLLLDEPFNGLDPGHEYLLLSVLSQFKTRGFCIVIALHNINLASRISDKMIALKDGDMVVHGTPSEVVNEETLNGLFEVKRTVFAHPAEGYPVFL